MTFSELNLREDYTCNHLWVVVKQEQSSKETNRL